MLILIAIMGFVVVAGLGFAFSGGSSGGAGSRTMKRAQAMTASRGQVERVNRAKTAAADAGNRRKQLLNTIKEQERRQRKASFSLSARLLQAGLSLSIRTFWIISACLGVATFLIALMCRVPILMVLGLTFISSMGFPRFAVSFLAKRRMKIFTSHFSDAIDIIVRGIRTGLPVNDCLRIIARESPAPLGPEFHRLVENLSMGLTMEQGLEKMFERMPTPELRFFTIVLAIQQKTGGNLAEALSNLSAVLRGRKLMREKIKALSSEATASAWIIGCLPPSVVVLITVTSPGYMTMMYTDPRGHMMLLFSAIWMGMGIFVMRRMINFKF
jgi:tight adherence protein B